MSPPEFSIFLNGEHTSERVYRLYVCWTFWSALGPLALALAHDLKVPNDDVLAHGVGAYLLRYHAPPEALHVLRRETAEKALVCQAAQLQLLEGSELLNGVGVDLERREEKASDLPWRALVLAG